MKSRRTPAFLLAATFCLVAGAFSTSVNAQTTPPGILSPNDIRAQRSFAVANGEAVSMDFQRATLELNFDPTSEQAVGKAVIEFTTLEQGLPYFLLDAPIQAARLDGKPVSVSTTRDEPGLNEIQLLSESVAPGTPHTLEIDYQVSSDNVSYRTGGIGFVTSMADIDSGNFLENYAPTNFEDDQYPMSATLNLASANTPHQLFTNGTVVQNGPSTWKIDFPPYFNTSSFYIHLTNKDLVVRTGTYKGIAREIPYTVYSGDGDLANAAAAEVPALFQELERTYGPYFHQSFTAYISGAGGMEHSGATITSLSALGHEMTHSWFARGVQPSNGNTGWIDEGIASWRDEGYQREAPADRAEANLAGFSIYERFTPYAAYTRGEQFMSELDYLFADQFGGLRPLLADFFAEYKGQLITTPMFENWLTQRTGQDLSGMFQRYVYGNGQPTGNAGAPGSAPGIPYPNSNHPPSLTPNEVENLR
jgi:aminopeptidase N